MTGTMLDMKVLSDTIYRRAKYLNVLEGKGRAEVLGGVFPPSWISDLFISAVRTGRQYPYRTANTTAVPHY